MNEQCLESANKIKMPLDILHKSILKFQNKHKCDINLVIEAFRKACDAVFINKKLLEALLSNKTCYCRVIIKAHMILENDLKNGPVS